MKRIVFAVALLASGQAGIAAPLSKAECSSIAAQVDGGTPFGDVGMLPRLIRDGDSDVAAAARRLVALHSGAHAENGLVNATQDLRYQLEVCARR